MFERLKGYGVGDKIARALAVPILGLSSVSAIGRDVPRVDPFSASGNVIASPNVELVFLDSTESEQDTQFRADISEFMAEITEDGYLKPASAYGVSSGTFERSLVVNGVYRNTISGKNLFQQILAQPGVQSPRTGTVYIVVMPRDVHETPEDSTKDFCPPCSYHNSVNGVPFAYIETHYRGGEEGYQKDVTEEMMSHEFVEATTDPIIGEGIVNRETRAEVADGCDVAKNGFNGYDVNKFMVNGVCTYGHYVSADDGIVKKQ